MPHDDERREESEAALRRDEIYLVLLERITIMVDTIAPIAASLAEGLTALNQNITKVLSVAEGFAPSAADISGLNDVLTGLTAANTTLAAWIAANTPTTAAAALTVSPSPAIVPLASTTAVPLTFTGGTGVITASGLPAGVTFDGANLVPDGTQLAGSTSVEFSDSSTPTALTTTVTVTVQ